MASNKNLHNFLYRYVELKRTLQKHGKVSLISVNIRNLGNWQYNMHGPLSIYQFTGDAAVTDMVSEGVYIYVGGRFCVWIDVNLLM